MRLDIKGVPAGWKVIARRLYNPECATDGHLTVVLCVTEKADTGEPEYTTWLHNEKNIDPQRPNSSVCGNGHYHQGNFTNAAIDFALRPVSGDNLTDLHAAIKRFTDGK